MVIDFNKWIRDDLDNKLFSTLKQINKNILHWDQDVLNSFFNGKYLELENLILKLQVRSQKVTKMN